MHGFASSVCLIEREVKDGESKVWVLNIVYLKCEWGEESKYLDETVIEGGF